MKIEGKTRFCGEKEAPLKRKLELQLKLLNREKLPSSTCYVEVAFSTDGILERNIGGVYIIRGDTQNLKRIQGDTEGLINPGGGWGSKKGEVEEVADLGGEKK